MRKLKKIEVLRELLNENIQYLDVQCVKNL